MALRRATVADAQALSALSSACFTETFGHLYPPEDLSHFLDEAYAVPAWASLLSDPAYATWLLEDDGVAIGYATAGACTLPHADVAPGDGELKRLYVLAAHQGGGRGSRLFDAAIRYGREGFLVSPTIARQWAAQVPELKVQPGFPEAFMPNGRAPQPGEIFRFPDHAATLEAIARTKGEAFYNGPLAERLESHSRQNGGVLRTSDLAAHKSDWIAPLQMNYRGYTLHELPPNGQGIVALIALGILSHFDMKSHPVDGPDSVHLQIEAQKLAFADAWRFVADLDHMTEVKPPQLLDPEYLKERAKLIDLKKAQDFGHGKPPKGGTVYLTAADASGMMVSYIQSNYMGFGSGVVVPGTGISLQNRGGTFSLKPGHPNQVGPRKRPYQTIIPGFLTRDGEPVMSFGVMGGTMQPQGHTQVVVRIADYDQHPQAACDGPRFRFVQGMDVSVEDGGFPPATLEELQRRGHRLVNVDDYNQFGCAQLIWRTEGGYIAASDPRRDGQAVGF